MSQPRITIPLKQSPAVIVESARAVLAFHGIAITEDQLRELGNNIAQGLVSLDEGLEDAA